MDGSHVNYMNCCFASFYYCIDVTFGHTYACTHKNSNVIPALSAFQSDKDRQEALVGPRIQFSGILGK